MEKNNSPEIVFFGSSEFSVICLEELKDKGQKPTLIVTTPDQPTGRGLKLTPTPVKDWAEKNNIECLTPEKLRQEFIDELKAKLTEDSIFLIASYGKIVPRAIIDLPKYKTLNIHPSLLPKYRGPSPLQEQILNDEKNIGVTIMLIDEQVDHGDIISQEKISINNWPISFSELEEITARLGARMFLKILGPWSLGEIIAIEQKHNEATFTEKVEKIDALIKLEDDPYKNFLKIQAYSSWPNAYFFTGTGENQTRVIIKKAKFQNGNLIIERVVPAGKKEMNFEDFRRGLKI